MCSVRADRVLAGLSPLSERTYATSCHTCCAGTLPANDGMPFGRPCTIVV
jgi:hypothetical protein